MKDLNVTISGYTDREIEKVREYTDKTFYCCPLKYHLQDICMQWLDKALEQIKEHDKIKSKSL